MDMHVSIGLLKDELKRASERAGVRLAEARAGLVLAVQALY